MRFLLVLIGLRSPCSRSRGKGSGRRLRAPRGRAVRAARSPRGMRRPRRRSCSAARSPAARRTCCTPSPASCSAPAARFTSRRARNGARISSQPSAAPKGKDRLRERHAALDALFMDDLHVLPGLVATQQELARCLAPLALRGCPVVLAHGYSATSLWPLLCAVRKATGGLGFRIVRLAQPTPRELRAILHPRPRQPPSPSAGRRTAGGTPSSLKALAPTPAQPAPHGGPLILDRRRRTPGILRRSGRRLDRAGCRRLARPSSRDCRGATATRSW